MESILIGIKRFIKNKNTVTIIAILASLGILYWAYNYRIVKQTEPINVPYATLEIAPRTLITADMVSTRKVPGGVNSKNLLTSTSQIVGKYVSNKAVIPNGGLFYSDMVVDWEDLPSSLFEDIPDGNTIVALQVNLESTYGNSIFPGNYIDLYYVTTLDNGKLMLGKFIESIKVLSVTDAEGNNVFETIEDNKTPTYLMFSVPEDMHLLLRKASYLDGQIFPVPRNAEYSNNPKETKVVSSRIQNYILDKTIDVANQDRVTSGGVSVIGGNNNDTQTDNNKTESDEKTGGNE